MSSPTASITSRSSLIELTGRPWHWLDAVPYTLLAVPLRLAVATIFWNSAMTHLAN